MRNRSLKNLTNGEYATSRSTAQLSLVVAIGCMFLSRTPYNRSKKLLVVEDAQVMLAARMAVFSLKVELKPRALRLGLFDGLPVCETVREDFSDGDDAWNYSTHDQTRSRESHSCEGVKEHCLDVNSTPTHSFMKYL